MRNFISIFFTNIEPQCQLHMTMRSISLHVTYMVATYVMVTHRHPNRFETFFFKYVETNEHLNKSILNPNKFCFFNI